MNSRIELPDWFNLRRVARLGHFLEHEELLLSSRFWLFIIDSVEEVTAATTCLPAPSAEGDRELMSANGLRKFLSSHDIAGVIENLRQQKSTFSDEELIAAVNYFWKNDAFIEVKGRDGGGE